MNKRKVYIICLSVFTAVLTASAFILGYGVSARSKAHSPLYSEIEEMERSTAEIKKINKDIQAKIDDLDTELSSKDTVNNYYMEYKKTHDDLTVEVEELKKQSASLDGEIEKIQTEEGGVAGLSQRKKGKTYSLSANEIYTCPDKIPAGRYIAKGSGTLTISSSSGKTRISQNLDVAYDHSYTFNLSDKESIRVSGNVTLTELK